MFVCHCKAVTDRTIRGLVNEGCTDVEELAEMCGAGDRCGSCIPYLEALIAAREEREEVGSPVLIRS